MDVGTAEFPEGNELTVEDSLIKLDWNITDTQRVVFNYQLTDGNRISVGDSASATGTYPFASNFYNKGERLETYGLQLFSNWTPVLRSSGSTTRSRASGWKPYWPWPRPVTSPPFLD